MEYSKRLAVAEFDRLGFQAKEIPESTGKRADLRVTDGQHTYHIEAKDKLEASDVPPANRDDLFRRKDDLVHNNTVSGIFRDAQKQLKSTPNTDGAFQLIWVHAEHDLQWQQVFATFYGTLPLSALYPNRDKAGTCFYFTYSAAFTMRDIEALILTRGDGLHLCMNEFSARREEFKQSRLYQTWAVGEIDPVKKEAAGEIIACRSMVSRKNHADVIKALKEQTGVNFVTGMLTRHSF